MSRSQHQISADVDPAPPEPLVWSFRACAVAAFMLGFFGFLPQAPPRLLDLAAALLKTFQLFALNVSPDELSGWRVWTAAFLAPLATLGWLVSNIAFLRTELRRRLRLRRLRRRPPTDVFLGGGDTAAAIAARRLDGATSQQRSAVVGLDLAESSTLERVLREVAGKAFVVVGNALTPAALRDVNAAAAARVWIISGDDVRNLAIAKHVLSLQKRPPPAAGPTQRVLINLMDRQLSRAHKSMFGELLSGVGIEFFSIPRLAARVLFEMHPPPLPASSQRSSPAPPMHIAVVGSGQLAAALVVHAAQHCVYSEAPEGCVRITVLGAGAQQLRERLYREFPALDPGQRTVADLRDLLPVATLEAHDCDETEISLGAWRNLQEAAAFSAVYVCLERDLETTIAATRAAALRDATAKTNQQAQPIVACIQQPGMDSWASRLGHAIADYHTFDVYAECIQPHELYPGALADERAQLINDAYANPNAADQTTVTTLQRARATWHDLPEEFRWSSRLSADHIGIKLQLLGIDSADPTAAEQIEQALKNPLQLEQLMRLEHRRMVVERLLDGWLPIPPNIEGQSAPSHLDRDRQKKILRLNHTLVPFDDLPRVDQAINQQARDAQIVRAIPHILRVSAATPSALRAEETTEGSAHID